MLCDNFRLGSGNIGEVVYQCLCDTVMSSLPDSLGLGLIGRFLNQGMLELTACIAQLQYQPGILQYAQAMR